MGLARLPLYLELSAYGAAVAEIQATEDPLPAWVTESLFYGLSPVPMDRLDSVESSPNGSPSSMFAQHQKRITLENQPQFSGDTHHIVSMPLPGAWRLKQHGSPLSVDSLKVEGATGQLNVRTNHPIPRLTGIYYYEITLLRGGPDFMVCVGFCNSTCSLSTYPGGDQSSWGLHSEAGHLFGINARRREYSHAYQVGDVVGCGYDFSTKSIFFTRNGISHGIAFEKIDYETIYPAIGVSGDLVVEANFGQADFRFDIVDYYSRKKSAVLKVVGTSPSPPHVTSVLNKLIADYLSHVGYYHTARELREQISKESPPEDVEMGEDIKRADHRQEIRRAIMANDIEQALAILESAYPNLLEANPPLKFNLHSRIFAKSVAHSENIEKTIELGRQLQLEFGDSPEPGIQRVFSQVVSLLSVDDPQSQVFRELHSTKSLAMLYESVNGAILESYGLPRVAVLPRLLDQAQALVTRLAEKDGSAATINVHKDFMPN